jgi:hypothetical protein
VQRLELASKRHWTVSFALSILWSKFKSAEELGNTEIVFVLLQREEELQEEEAAKIVAAVSVDDPLANDPGWSVEQEEGQQQQKPTIRTIIGVRREDFNTQEIVNWKCLGFCQVARKCGTI